MNYIEDEEHNCSDFLSLLEKNMFNLILQKLLDLLSDTKVRITFPFSFLRGDWLLRVPFLCKKTTLLTKNMPEVLIENQKNIISCFRTKNVM